MLVRDKKTLIALPAQQYYSLILRGGEDEMTGKEGSILGFNAMIDLRESGGIPNQFYNHSAKNGSGSEKTWYEDVEACIDCDPDPCCPQVAKFLRRAFVSLGMQEGFRKEELEELYDSYIKDGTIQ